nr:hypothetical protein [Tanacetum cinerariifolium]
MTRRSSNRNKKVLVKFNDMIHDLSTKGPKSKNSCGEDMVKPAENDKETRESDDVTDCGIDEGTSEEEMEEVTECLGMGRRLVKLLEWIPILAIDNKLFIVPTRVNDKGEEIVIFDEDLVNRGSEKWKFTVCGYFFESSLLVYEMKYNIIRMRAKHGLRDIVVNRDEICFAKFKDEEGMNLVIKKSTWMSTKGISTISSRLGRPIMMDKMTADMCSRGTRWLGYARVLVEIEACKCFLDEIEIVYVDRQNSRKNSKWVKIEYSWKPMVCNHCKVFGHSFFECTLRPRAEDEQIKSDIAGNKGKSKDGFTDVRNGENFNGFCGNYNRRQCGNQGFKNGVKTMFVPKVSTDPMMDKVASDKQSENNLKEGKGEMMTDKRLIVVDFVKKKKQPFIEESKDWNYDMIQYFKNARKAMERGDNDDSDEEDVEIVYDESIQVVIADEIEGMGSGKHPWVVMGDFNVTLKSAKHSNWGPGCNIDMQEFGGIVNKLEVDDLCSTGFYYTWTKSLKNPTNSTLKKLDRILVNDSFILKYYKAHDKKKKAISILEEYTEVSNDEVKLLHQKAKIDWLREGDKNTAYFHNILKARKHKNRVESICDDSRTRF